jgi:sugar lactone lactonase YvrE
MKTRLIAITTLVLMLALPAALYAQGTDTVAVEMVIEYDTVAGELPEGIATDEQGNIYVSLSPLGEIRKISSNGSESLFATLPPAGESGSGLLGLAVDSAGNVCAALGTDDPSTSGVYRISPDGTYERFVGSEAITFPNSLAFDEQGNLYVTDTIMGAIWLIPRGGTTELWLQDDLLVGLNLPDLPFPFPLGANGIAYRAGNLYVANTEKAHVVRIPVLTSGGAGAPEIIAAGDELLPLDGIALDAHGNIYALVIAQSKLVRIDPHDGTVTTLATAEDGLDFPASLAFGTREGDRQSVFVTNYAIGPPGGVGPSVVKIDVGTAELLPETGGAVFSTTILAMALGGLAILGGLGLALSSRPPRQA